MVEDNQFATSSNAMQLKLGMSYLEDWAVTHRPAIAEELKEKLAHVTSACNILVMEKSILSDPALRKEVRIQRTGLHLSNLIQSLSRFALI